MIRHMKDSQLLNKALSIAGDNRAEMGRKLGVSRQVVEYWLRTKRLPDWRRDAVRKMVESRRD